MLKSTSYGIDESQVLVSHHQFVRDDEADEADKGDWRVRLSRKYYDKLYKEYGIVDLSKYESGQLGVRWRTEKEVIDGKGQYTCGARKCDVNGREKLKSYEVPFKYEENGYLKMELVKVRVCDECACKLDICLSESGKKRKSKEPDKPHRKRTKLDASET